MKKLTFDEFKATQFDAKKIEEGEPPFEFWSYVEQIPVEDFGDADCSKGEVGKVYRMGDQYEHVLIQSQYEGVAMVIVLDLQKQEVYGHYLLNININAPK